MRARIPSWSFVVVALVAACHSVGGGGGGAPPGTGTPDFGVLDLSTQSSDGFTPLDLSTQPGDLGVAWTDLAFAWPDFGGGGAPDLGGLAIDFGGGGTNCGAHTQGDQWCNGDELMICYPGQGALVLYDCLFDFGEHCFDTGVSAGHTTAACQP